MENLNETVSNVAKQLQARSRQNKGLEYRYLWVSVNFALARDGDIRKIGARAFGVFFVIRTYMNKTNVAFPSLKTIAWESKLAIGTVKKEIDVLIKHGWLKKSIERSGTGKFDNAKYTILENDLIRGTGAKSFMAKPISRFDNGK